MTEWKECKLGDVVFFSNGKSRPDTSGYIPIYGGNGILEYTDQSNNDGETIIIGRVGAYCGSVYYENRPVWVSDNALAAKPKEQYYAKYLYYLLKFSDLNQYAEGSSHPLLTQSLLNSIDIVFCDNIDEQKAIAEVLSSLDDKIDLLTRQNKTLEDLAQAYFRKWFIEDASSEWEVGKLGDEFNITMGQSPKGETYNDLKIGLPFFQGKAEFGFRFPLEKQYCSEPIKIADKFDTLLSVRAPVGALNMALYKCCIGRGLAIPIHKKGYKHYTFYKMKSLQELFNTFDDDGTVFGSISREKFLSIDNVIPPEKLVCYFDNFAKYFDLKIYENTVQIRTLSKLRDTLLPKLISGEVRVNI
jgi:type I restriction enzyme S subunit